MLWILRVWHKMLTGSDSFQWKLKHGKAVVQHKTVFYVVDGGTIRRLHVRVGYDKYFADPSVDAMRRIVFCTDDEVPRWFTYSYWVHRTTPITEISIPNKMQSETADFAPGAATWRTNSTKHTRLLWLCSFALLCENMTSSTKPEVNNLFHCRQRRTGYR